MIVEPVAPGVFQLALSYRPHEILSVSQLAEKYGLTLEGRDVFQEALTVRLKNGKIGVERAHDYLFFGPNGEKLRYQDASGREIDEMAVVLEDYYAGLAGPAAR